MRTAYVNSQSHFTATQTKLYWLQATKMYYYRTNGKYQIYSYNVCNVHFVFWEEGNQLQTVNNWTGSQNKTWTDLGHYWSAFKAKVYAMLKKGHSNNHPFTVWLQTINQLDVVLLSCFSCWFVKSSSMKYSNRYVL